MTCPLAGYRIDENSARIVAGLVALGTILGLYFAGSAARWIFPLLALDFAARVGLIFTLALTVLAFLGLSSAVRTVGAILLLCALLESLAGFCVGCQLWSAWYAVQEQVKK